jgi:hypothetical protein
MHEPACWIVSGASELVVSETLFHRISAMTVMYPDLQMWILLFEVSLEQASTDVVIVGHGTTFDEKISRVSIF